MDQTDLNILTIGTDETIFDEGSALRQRVLDYSANFTSFHVFCKSGRRPSTETLGKVVIHPLPKFFPLFFLTGYRTGSFLLCRGGPPEMARLAPRGGGRWVISAENTSWEGILAFLLSRRWGVPLQLQIHTDVFSPWYRCAGWKERVRYGLARFLIPRADCVRVVSQRIKRSIIFNFQFSIFNQFSNSKKVTVLPIFTDISKFFDAQPDPIIEERFKNYDFKMIAVGRFVDREKNFSMLIEVMRDFIKICPKALLVLAGDGPDKSTYQLLVTRYQLAKNVIIEPWRNDLSSFYKSFDLYIMPSNYEGWGRTVIEAMASGLPVVMTDVGLAGEVVKNGENGVIVTVADKGAMLRTVRDLYQNSELRAKFAEVGSETVKNLEPKSKENYLKLYASSYCYPKN